MTKYPDWLPKGAIAHYEWRMRDSGSFFLDDGQAKKVLDIYRDLVMQEQMMEAWLSLKRLGEQQDKAGAAWDPYFWLFEAVSCGIKGPVGTQINTPAQRQKLINKIKETSETLSSLIKETELNVFLIEDQHTGLFDDDTVFQGKDAELMSDFLMRFASRVKGDALPVMTSRPNSEDAARVYFVRYLTNTFRNKYSRPMRTVVLNATIVAFDDCNLTERQIIRIAP